LLARAKTHVRRYGIAVLPAEEWRKPAPLVACRGDTLIGIEGKLIRVLDAFFFEEL
jgi:hypothetical protein